MPLVDTAVRKLLSNTPEIVGQIVLRVLLPFCGASWGIDRDTEKKREIAAISISNVPFQLVLDEAPKWRA